MLLDWLKAAADETRLRLLVVCSQGEFTVSELTFILGQSQPRVSRHLKRLCDAGLLLRYKEQTWVFYGVSRQAHASRFLSMCVHLHQFEQPKSELTLFEQDQRQMTQVIANRDAKAKEILTELTRQQRILDLSEDQELVLCQQIKTAIGDHDLGVLLDIGTGSGRMLRLLGKGAKQAVGIDISLDMLTLARAQIRAQGLDHCLLRHGDMYHLPYPDATFNTIIFDTVLSEASRPTEAISEARRLLAAKGFIILIEVSENESTSRPVELAQTLVQSSFNVLKHFSFCLEPGTVALAVAVKS